MIALLNKRIYIDGLVMRDASYFACTDEFRDDILRALCGIATGDVSRWARDDAMLIFIFDFLSRTQVARSTLTPFTDYFAHFISISPWRARH